MATGGNTHEERAECRSPTDTLTKAAFPDHAHASAAAARASDSHSGPAVTHAFARRYAAATGSATNN